MLIYDSGDSGGCLSRLRGCLTDVRLEVVESFGLDSVRGGVENGL